MSATPSSPPLSAGGSSKDSLSGRLQQLGEELHCSLCLEYFEDPVTLPCQHSFCRECIRGAVKPYRHDAHKQEVDCPLCRKKAVLNGSVDTCVLNLPRNFQLAGIIEKFCATEKAKTRLEDLEELQFQRQLTEQIELSKKQHDDQERQQQIHDHPSNQQTRSSPSQATPAPGNVVSCDPGDLPTCKMCSFPGVIRCTQCDHDYCLECQQVHTHDGESTGAQEEFLHPEKVAKNEEEEQQQQQRLQHLQQKQQHLQLELDQQQALSDFNPSPVWHQQQMDRWEELQQQGTKRQVSEEYPPRHQSESYERPSEPLSWPLGQQCMQNYQQQPHQQLVGGYPNSGPQQQQQQQFSPTSLTSQITCTHCQFPASTHCEECHTYFCWQCMGERHDSKQAQFQRHKMVELIASLSSPSSLDSKQEIEVPSHDNGSPSTIPLKIPYTCDIKGMEPGKHITVAGQPNKEKCSRFHINLMCNKNLKSGDIALHFNPRFTFPNTVVRNTRTGGKYGSEERNGPKFPFAAGRPFKIEIMCLSDKFKVVVDNQPFITYAHRIKDLHLIKFLHVNGDVEISSVDGCM